MNKEPMEIKLRENYVPKALTVPRKVPYARRDDEIKEIRKLEAEGIIEPVGDRPTSFVVQQYVRLNQMEQFASQQISHISTSRYLERYTLHYRHGMQFIILIPKRNTFLHLTVKRDTGKFH